MPAGAAVGGGVGLHVGDVLLEAGQLCCGEIRMTPFVFVQPGSAEVTWLSEPMKAWDFLMLVRVKPRGIKFVLLIFACDGEIILICQPR